MTGTHSIRSVAPPSLRSLVAAAYLADPADRLIAPIGDQAYSTLFQLIPAALAVLRTAATIEPNPINVLEWYRSDPVAELGHLTAEQLVSLGRAEVVIAFLCSISAGWRG